MKQHIKFELISVLCVAAFATTSCEYASFLDQKPYSQTSPENFYKTENDIKLTLIGAYETINTNKVPGSSTMQRGSYAQGMLYIMNAPSDEVVTTTQSSGDDGTEMEWANFIESTRVICDFWKVFYTGINRCNLVLHYVDGVPMTDAARVQYISEARFLRAFFYYHLAWCFGGVPIVTDFSSTGQEPRASLEKTWEFILEDLDYAYANISTSSVTMSHASINKYGVAAYIGRVCNYLAACRRHDVGAAQAKIQPLNDFSFVDAKAMTAKALAALEFAKSGPYTLLDDYRRNFYETTKTDQYREALFVTGNTSTNFDYLPNSYYLFTPSSNGLTSPIVYGGRHVPTPRIFYMYDKDDPRRDHNCTGRMTDGNKEASVDGVIYPYPFRDDTNRQKVEITEGGKKVKVDNPLYDKNTQSYLATSGMQLSAGKYRLAALGELNHTYQQHSVSIPLMRLADVYLMYAEALYYSKHEDDGSDDADARVYLEMVQKRAAGTGDEVNGEKSEAEKETVFQTLKANYNTGNFINDLLEERERELVFECSRKWDLIRFNRIDDAIKSLSTKKVTEAEGHHWYGDPSLPVIESKYLTIQSYGYLDYGINMLQRNWMPNKIWLPISSVQISVNHNLKQNAGW